MRIAQLAPPSAPIWSLADGYVQRSIALLADGLVDVGDEVTLVAPEGSRTHARLVSTPLDDRTDDQALIEHLTGAQGAVGDADVVHDHTDLRALLRAMNGHPRIVHTLRNGSRADPVPDDVDRVHVVATTWSQARRHPDIAFAAVIRDGIRVGDHPLVRHRNERIAYVGSAASQDGPLMAIAVAEMLGLELVLALSIDDEQEGVYWRETLAPRVNDATVRIRLMSVPTDRTERQAVLGRVRGLVLAPPLGDDLAYLALEAGAVGTPVIAFESDGVQEFVEDGVTGFVLPSVDVGRIAEAIDRSGTIDPAACRERVADRFSYERMVRQYHDLYERLLDGSLYERLLDLSTWEASDGNGSPNGPPRPSEAPHGSDDWASTYLAVAAHDLRGPLSAIRGFAQTLVGHGAELGEDERNDMLGRIIAITDRLDLVARNVLDTDRIERGGLELTLEDVSLAGLCEDVAGAVGTSHPVGIALDAETAWADRFTLERILTNLVANAVEHTPDGTPIFLRSWDEDGSVVVAVEDEGPGTPQELVEAVNAPGVEHLSQVWSGGSGLGVALVRRLAELHGGELRVLDRDGGGASFRVSLPVPAAHDRRPRSEPLPVR